MTGEIGVSWLPVIETGPRPVYLKIVDALADARSNGRLQPGDRLPPQRELARLLGVDLTTVTRAFSEARRRNLIDATAGRGTFVTPGEPEEPVLDLSMNIPPAPSGLNLPALIRTGIEGLLKRSSAEALLSYHPGPGSPAERAAGSSWLTVAGDRLPVDRVVVGSGAQALLAAVVLSETHEGDTILADPLTYPGLIALAGTTRRKLAAVANDGDGMLPDRLEETARRYGARVLYLNPTLQNPTASVMLEGRRRELARMADRLKLTIVEDDPYNRLLAAPPPAFLTLAPERTFHVATLAKCISPFLRTAFLTAPGPQAADRIAAAIRGTTMMAPPLMTGLACEWLRSGLADEITTAVRAEAQARQKIARNILPKGFPASEASLHLWYPLESRLRSAELADIARRRGLAISPAEEFAIGTDFANGFRLALGATPNRERLKEGLESLASILSGVPGSSRPKV
ncbi:PLP-dependent aminotransferase family protein [Mesorhizobium sp.]|uniref:aminotransferase-like domain-containing protein n=1 Tax=Mesorhizobium sp. TaxID=1871066 RepID=UPI000FE3EAC0|nr:PLP-dependent aminotransferase family protein [Mesorhizobium sp.]RWH69704.1 MAG: PLP-dependent aminotransferase family protein [Mesorhizobium sp.]RWL28295.1 MAG: PLP-dependent aminotransferase family protein [Mesorhizobium sp.]RWL29856.1 MAG: PLP-dependent aminotransferase family protein [Mesorhizobium sp.]RWL38153.1 MAG: PLP-dependent aminotransferase family protein [Mesorhizobium sp.]RWL51618.1 MAG: PLP-dependent aminotransferase family protein [Mesorhizobium sp.]